MVNCFRSTLMSSAGSFLQNLINRLMAESARQCTISVTRCFARYTGQSSGRSSPIQTRWLRSRRPAEWRRRCAGSLRGSRRSRLDLETHVFSARRGEGTRRAEECDRSARRFHRHRGIFSHPAAALRGKTQGPHELASRADVRQGGLCAACGASRVRSREPGTTASCGVGRTCSRQSCSGGEVRHGDPSRSDTP